MSVREHLALDDEQLLAECDVDLYKASGPGGQHRNKVSSAVRLRHRPTGVIAQGEDSRSQHENKRLAVKRLRMNIAAQVRRPVDPERLEVHPEVAACIHRPKNKSQGRKHRIEVGRRDRRFWHVAAVVLDVLEACGGRLAETASAFGVSTGNLVSHLKEDRHLFAAAGQIRTRHSQKPLK